MTRAPVLLLDSASLYFRAFFGVPDRRENPEEPPNNAVRGFLDMIATLVSAHRPAGLVACWTTTGARRSGSRRSPPTRPTGSPTGRTWPRSPPRR